MDHLFLMLWHAFLVSVFFAFLWRRTRSGRRNLFLKTFGIMAVGSTLLGWIIVLWGVGGVLAAAALYTDDSTGVCIWHLIQRS